MCREEIEKVLREGYGQSAEFHQGQLEAIETVLEGKRTLVVQKTGWGKSLVYFIATKLLRKNKEKLTIIISPLLVLMDNQISAAQRLKLNVKTLNSSNTGEWKEIMDEIDRNEVDALIISPERLANDDFKEKLNDCIAAKIGLFVVDEAHCISDWGHDFRPDYRRIVNIVNLLPKNVPVLATTATANDRVVKDIRSQLGDDMVVSRGPLIRESIAVQTVLLKTREERL